MRPFDCQQTYYISKFHKDGGMLFVTSRHCLSSVQLNKVMIVMM